MLHPFLRWTLAGRALAAVLLIAVPTFALDFGQTLRELESERDAAKQLQFAQTLAQTPAGWSPEEETRALRWLLGARRGPREIGRAHV